MLAPELLVAFPNLKETAEEVRVVAPVTAKVPVMLAAPVDKARAESLPKPSVKVFSDPLNGPLSVTLIRLSYVSCGVVPVKVVPIF
jgi:hypothetical protein